MSIWLRIKNYLLRFDSDKWDLTQNTYAILSRSGTCRKYALFWSPFLLRFDSDKWDLTQNIYALLSQSGICRKYALFWSPFLLRFDSDKWDSTQTWLRHLSKKMAGRASAWVSSWIKHRSLKKMINLQLHPTYWLTHIEMRRKICYFVVFQPSKVEMFIFSASILINLTHFPRWLRKSAI